MRPYYCISMLPVHCMNLWISPQSLSPLDGRSVVWNLLPQISTEKATHPTCARKRCQSDPFFKLKADLGGQMVHRPNWTSPILSLLEKYDSGRGICYSQRLSTGYRPVCAKPLPKHYVRKYDCDRGIVQFRDICMSLCADGCYRFFMWRWWSQVRSSYGYEWHACYFLEQVPPSAQSVFIYTVE